MKTTTELMERYEQLFQHMAESKDVKKMRHFGSDMNDLMERAIKVDASFAEHELEKLESMNWQQYLTQHEAEDICKSLNPECRWSFDVWERVMRQMNLESERQPCFNKYALWVTMNAKYSDHAETIAQKILVATLEEVSTEQMVSIVHGLAVDSLTDKDERFNVRKYFLDE